MLNLGINSLNAIEQGIIVPTWRVKIYFQNAETFTMSDYLAEVGSIKSSMSSVGNYEIGNATIILKNTDYYFSRKFYRERPNKRLVEVYLYTGYEAILIFSGRINSARINPVTTVTLNINA